MILGGGSGMFVSVSDRRMELQVNRPLSFLCEITNWIPSQKMNKLTFRYPSVENARSFSCVLLSIRWHFIDQNNVLTDKGLCESKVNQFSCRCFQLKGKLIDVDRIGNPWLSPINLMSIKLRSLHFRLLKLGQITHGVNFDLINCYCSSATFKNALLWSSFQ